MREKTKKPASHGAPTGIRASISFQHPINRAGGRTSNVRLKKGIPTHLRAVKI
jgi:hypothetical protein